MDKNFKYGFTLAEVLLTLAVIGVVAALTVPSLMSSTMDKKLVVGAKKAYNTLQNAVELKRAATGLTPSDTSGDQLISFLIGETTDGEQILKYTDINRQVVQTPDGIVMVSSGGKCGTGEIASSTYCTVTVDVNGVEGPNYSGVNAGYTANEVPITKLVPHSPANYHDTFRRDIVIFRVNGLLVTPDGDDFTSVRYIKYSR